MDNDRDSPFDVLMIGGGIVGLATAWRLLQAKSELRVALIEKEASLGAHQTGHNSGVIHAGLYYRPGSEKAKLSVTGLRQLIGFCREHGIAHEQCGKLVIARSTEELPRLDALFERGIANGLTGLQRLDTREIRDLEPAVAGVAAVRVPETGIVDYLAVAGKLGDLIRQAGGQIHLNNRCLGLQRSQAHWLVATQHRQMATRFVVTCGGLHSDRLVRLTGQRPRAKIIPFRGEYYTLQKGLTSMVRHLIYPVPDPRFPFLGVHITRMIHGGIEVGPNAVLAFAREGYRWTTVNPRDLAEALSFPGLWRFLFKYPSLCGYEIRRSLSRREFCRSLQTLVPSIRKSDLLPGGTGVRAQAMTADGSLVEDFSFEEQPGILHVVNAPSPAATASLAIGTQLADRVLKQLT